MKEAEEETQMIELSKEECLKLELQCQAERFLVMFSDILRHQCDEDGTHIVGDYQTIVYGDGETLFEALRDYIISLIEYSQLLLSKTAEESVSALGKG